MQRKRKGNLSAEAVNQNIEYDKFQADFLERSRKIKRESIRMKRRMEAEDRKMARETEKDEAKIEKLREEIDIGFKDWIDLHMPRVSSDEG